MHCVENFLFHEVLRPDQTLGECVKAEVNRLQVDFGFSCKLGQQFIEFLDIVEKGYF